MGPLVKNLRLNIASRLNTNQVRKAVCGNEPGIQLSKQA
jgi:hypothetical protein